MKTSTIAAIALLSLTTAIASVSSAATTTEFRAGVVNYMQLNMSVENPEASHRITQTFSDDAAHYATFEVTDLATYSMTTINCVDNNQIICDANAPLAPIDTDGTIGGFTKY